MPYKDYDWCIDQLQKGIKATKFSFNSPKVCKEVIIKLNKSLTKISYQNQVKPADFFGMYFKFPRSFKIDKVLGFTFGPSSFTFQYLRKDILKRTEFLRFNLLEISAQLEELQGNYEPDQGVKSFEEEEELKDDYERINANPSFFHAWNCVSLHMSNATVDFVIKDKNQCFALIHVLNHLVNKVQADKVPGDCLKPFNLLNFRMKVSYEAWRKRIPIQ